MLAAIERYQNTQCITACRVQEPADDEVIDPSSKLTRSQSDQSSMECTGQTGLFHGGRTPQFTALKGSAANLLVPDTAAHLQRARGVMPPGVRAVLVAHWEPRWL